MDDKILLALAKAFELINTFKPLFSELLDNEAARRGLTREQLKAFTDRLVAETDAITKVDMSNEGEANDGGGSGGDPHGPGRGGD